MINNRALSDEFLHDLKTGSLKGLMERVKNDDTLMLAIRDGYVNVYYRGGSLFNLKKSNDSYSIYFDDNFKKDNPRDFYLPEPGDINGWMDIIPYLKEAMDFHFFKSRKLEREFQQIVFRENNFSTVSKETEYFITDIEFDFKSDDSKARFDMLGVRWLRGDRKHLDRFVPVLIEMKYGDGALDGDSGLIKHLDDLNKFVSSEHGISCLTSMIPKQFQQLVELDMFDFNKTSNWKEPSTTDEKPEVIIILANHNPSSKRLQTILESEEFNQKASDCSKYFNLKFFVSSFAGYGMHSNNMFDLEQFKHLVKSLSSPNKS